MESGKLHRSDYVTPLRVWLEVYCSLTQGPGGWLRWRKQENGAGDDRKAQSAGTVDDWVRSFRDGPSSSIVQTDETGSVEKASERHNDFDTTIKPSNNHGHQDTHIHTYIHTSVAR